MFPVFTKPRGFRKETLLGASTTAFISLSTSDKVSFFPVPEVGDESLSAAAVAETVGGSFDRKRFAQDFGGAGGETTGEVSWVMGWTSPVVV